MQSDGQDMLTVNDNELHAKRMNRFKLDLGEAV